MTTPQTIIENLQERLMQARQQHIALAKETERSAGAVRELESIISVLNEANKQPPAPPPAPAPAPTPEPVAPPKPYAQPRKRRQNVFPK
jgi:hypothetical protein